MTAYDAPPRHLAADSIRIIENALALKVAVHDAKTAAAQTAPDVLRAVLRDLERGDIHLDVSRDMHLSPTKTCYRCGRLLHSDAVVGDVGRRRERFCSHTCRLQVTAGGAA